MEHYKIKILFVSADPITDFIKTDLDILKKHFDLRVIRWTGLINPMVLIKIMAEVLWADITFSWFADIHAFWAVLLSKIFRKKSIVVVGGYEVAKVPEIRYGGMLNPKSALIVKYVLDNADKLLAVSEFNKKEILKCTDSKYVELVYNGVDCNKFKPLEKKEDLVVTVGSVTKNICKLKGIHTFVKASLAFPELKFVIIGNYDVDIRNRLKLIAPNIEFTGGIPHEEVASWLEKAKVYCQFSYRESFGMALAESMCCECIPVVTNNAALPEIVGDTGFYVPYGDSTAAVGAIRAALKSDKGRKARERVIKMFPIERREKELMAKVEDLF